MAEPSYSELTLLTCPECGNVASIEWEAWIDDLLHLKLRCVERHWFLMPAERITYYGTGTLYLPPSTEPGDDTIPPTDAAPAVRPTPAPPRRAESA